MAGVRLKEEKSREELYRLNSTELNALIHQRSLQFKPLSFSMNGVHLCHLVKRHGKKIIICPMTKDARDIKNETQLPFFYDFIMQFKENHLDRDYILLMPVLKCRGAYRLPTEIPGVKRLHAVLWECDLETMHITEHDSQSWYCKYLLWYPDKREDMKLPRANKDQSYGNQGRYDDYSCGYYTTEYLIQFLIDGHANHFPNIKLSIANDNQNKYEYLKKYGVLIDNSVYRQPTTYPCSAEMPQAEWEDGLSLKDWVNIDDESLGLSVWEWEDEQIVINEETPLMQSKPSVLLGSSLFSEMKLRKSVSFSNSIEVETVNVGAESRKLSLSN